MPRVFYPRLSVESKAEAVNEEIPDTIAVASGFTVAARVPLLLKEKQ
jgi:hypothetical protein